MKYGFMIPVFIMILGACMFLEPDYLRTVSAGDLHRIKQKGDIFLVDVHIPEQKHINGTDLFVPFNKIGKNIGKFPKDKQAPVYIYCKSGPMGNAAARSLYKQGYKNLFNLTGGIEAWERAGYKVE